MPLVLPAPRTIILGGAGASFLLLCVMPILYMLVISFISADGGFSFENYRQLLIDSRQSELLGRS
ncbi:MAG: hypothetical protein LC742_09110, partial [Acidobacteria bacterium]|nr:hypothetical protein [Acidobacteriota bacterium]